MIEDENFTENSMTLKNISLIFQKFLITQLVKSKLLFNNNNRIVVPLIVV